LYWSSLTTPIQKQIVYKSTSFLTKARIERRP
jgi:hypothetical protein